MISGTAGSTSFFLKKSCLETKRFSRHAWQVNDVVHPKTVEGRKDLQSFSKHSRTPITRVTMRPVSGLAILSLNPSLQPFSCDCTLSALITASLTPSVIGDRPSHPI